MDIIRVTSQEYAKFAPAMLHTFNSTQFCELNKDKCDTVHYLILKDSKVRAGIILGEREDGLYSPFSAPFGGLSIKTDEKLELITNAVGTLKKYAEALNKTIKITLPPAIYNETAVTKIAAAMLSTGAKITHSDINYHYELSRFPNYENHLSRNARKNFRNAMANDWEFAVLDNSDESISTAYNIIKANRESHGYPLRMSLQSVLDTAKVIPADFMVLRLNGETIAAAQVFHVVNGIAQVIYWGDAPGYSELRPMNWFTYKIFEHYHNLGLRVLDIGPSSEKGIPSFGLCDFKEGIGCIPTLKHSFLL